jgi:hypothetical protein
MLKKKKRRRREEVQKRCRLESHCGFFFFFSFSPGRVEAGEEKSCSPASAPFPLSPKTQKIDKDPHVFKL